MSTRETVAGQVLLVDNVADLAAATVDGVPSGALEEGQLAFVRSLRTYWVFSPARRVTADNITAVNTTAPGQFLRDEEYHDESWLTQATWFVNPTTGNDENDGVAALTPIRTWGELVRRLGAVFYVRQLTHITLLGAQNVRPVDTLSWEVRYGGLENPPPGPRPCVVIERARDEVAAPLTTAVDPDPLTNDIGLFVTSTAGAFDDFTYPILRCPDIADHCYVVIADAIDNDVNAALASPAQRVDEILSIANMPANASTLQAFYPGFTNIKTIVCDKDAVIIESAHLEAPQLDGVSLIGCVIAGGQTTDCKLYASTPDLTSHYGTNLLLGSRQLNGCLNYGELRLGDFVSFTVAGNVINKGSCEIKQCLQVQGTSFVNQGLCRIYNHALFGGVSNAAPSPAPGAYEASVGSSTELTNAKAPNFSASCAIAGCLLISPLNPVCVDPFDLTVGAAAPVAMPDNFGTGVGGLYQVGDFDGSGSIALLELKGGATITALD